MKKRISFYFLVVFMVLTSSAAFSQETDTTTNYVDTTATNPYKLYLIQTYGGAEFVGTIVYQDSKEVTIRTKDRGDVTIPKYEVKVMRAIEADDISQTGIYLPDQVFATRYFLTTNALPIKKGESYVMINLWGPEAHFAVSDNFGVGIMTSWFGIPMIANAKYTFEIAENVHGGIGALLGWGSYGAPSAGGVLPFGMLTFGDRKSNFNISGGYAQIWADGDAGGSALLSAAALAQIGRNVSFVFDSFIIPNAGGAGLFILSPGLRFQSQDNKAFQFGFAGVIYDNQMIPLPIPMVNWFIKF